MGLQGSIKSNRIKSCQFPPQSLLIDIICLQVWLKCCQKMLPTSYDLGKEHFLLCFVSSIMLITVFPEPPRCKKAIQACRAGTSTILWLQRVMMRASPVGRMDKESTRIYLMLHVLQLAGSWALPFLLLFSPVTSHVLKWRLKVTFFSVPQLDGCWRPDAVAAVHWSLANTGPTIALWQVSPNPLPCTGTLVRDQEPKHAVTQNQMTTAWEVEVSFLMSSMCPVPLKRFSTRNLPLHLPH